MSIEKAINEKALEILRTKGIEVTCPFCKEKFLAKDSPATCSNCGKTLDIDFQIK